MPVHAHLADLGVLGFTEDGAAGIHPLARAAAPVGAAELGREPRPGRVDLTGLESDLGLVQRDVLPVRPDGVDSRVALAERRAEEHGVGCEHRGDRVHVAPLPPRAKLLQQLAIRRAHGAQYTPIRNYGSARMVHGVSHVTPHRQEEEAPMMKRILATTAVLGLCALPLAAQGHAATAGNEMTITGSVVDLNCHNTNGASGAVLAAATLGCRAPAPGGFTLLFLGRSPAASLGGRSLSWAPDPDQSRIIGFDGRLRIVRQLSSPRLATPMAVAPLGPADLLVTERTGEGVVLDTAGRAVREWDSPDVASLYAAAGAHVVAVRSPYYVPELASPEPDTAPLIRVLDTQGRPIAGLATIRRPALPQLSYLVNAGAVAAAPDGSVYYAPLVRDEIRKYGPGGGLRWSAKRGLER